MKERDNKRTRNHRRWREMLRARDKRENLIGVDTGFTDKKGKPIRTGDLVSIGDSVDIVLFHKEFDSYCALRGCWYGERNPYDPRSYGKVDYIFRGKPRKMMEVEHEEENHGDT